MKKIIYTLILLVMVSCTTYEDRVDSVEQKGYTIIRCAKGDEGSGTFNTFICKDSFDNIVLVETGEGGKIENEIVILNLHKICDEVEEIEESIEEVIITEPTIESDWEYGD